MRCGLADLDRGAQGSTLGDRRTRHDEVADGDNARARGTLQAVKRDFLAVLDLDGADGVAISGVAFDGRDDAFDGVTHSDEVVTRVTHQLDDLAHVRIGQAITLSCTGTESSGFRRGDDQFLELKLGHHLSP